MGDFLEAAATFMDAKKEQIYMNEEIKSAFDDFSRILINLMKERGIELSEIEAKMIADDYFNEIVDPIDVIIIASYLEGFIDNTKFQDFMKGLK